MVFSFLCRQRKEQFSARVSPFGQALRDTLAEVPFSLLKKLWSAILLYYQGV